LGKANAILCVWLAFPMSAAKIDPAVHLVSTNPAVTESAPHGYLKDKSNLQERMFRTYRGIMFEPTIPFECAIRELQALAEHGTLSQIRECQECKHFYIANKWTASRAGRREQKFCRTCGGTARAKAHRLRSKMRGAAGHTGKKVTADPSYAKPSTR
jgi:hypothetical protein